MLVLIVDAGLDATALQDGWEVADGVDLHELKCCTTKSSATREKHDRSCSDQTVARLLQTYV